MIVHVVGAGLIGTSIGLALRDAADVLLSDPVEEHVRVAVDRGAGRAWSGERADLLVACCPPAAVADVLADAVERDLASTLTHVASVQAQVQAQLDARGLPGERTCGSHPLAGRERGGPAAATAGLFLDRTWVLCAGPKTSPAAVDAVRALVVACGAVPVEATPQAHDAAVALVSHLPQVAASAVAARLLEAGDDSAFALAGPGVQDTTRIAASDPALWTDVLSSNAAQVGPQVRALAADLARLADALDVLSGDDEEQRPKAAAAVQDLLRRGNQGRSRLPVKQRAADLTAVVVSVVDQPGQLAGLLVDAAAAQVNVEDVRVEHLAGRPRGLVELLVRSPDADRAARALADAGWDVLDRS